MTHVVVLTTAPSEEEAHKLADMILRERLAACIQVTSPITAIYRWKGEVYHDTEWQLWIKTTEERARQLTTWIPKNHSGDLPEVITLPIAGGLPAYLNWITDETR